MIHRKLKHIDKSRVLQVKYEDIVLSPEAEMKRICNFLAVDFDSNIFNFHKSTRTEFHSRLQTLDEAGRNLLTVTMESITQEINPSKIDLWKKQMKPHQSDLIWSICRKTADLYNYTANGSKKIVYFDFFFRSYYRSHLLNKVIIKPIYYNLPFPVKHWLKKMRLKIHGKA
jgi:hypothetical protein